MRESRTSGSVRGVAREGHPYLDRTAEDAELSRHQCPNGGALALPPA